MNEQQPSEKSMQRMEKYCDKYWEKTGTSPHPNAEVTDSVVKGLAAHVDELGRPLCPCNFYPDKKAELERSREWVCACDEMKIWKILPLPAVRDPRGSSDHRIPSRRP